MITWNILYSIVWYSTEDRGQRTEDRGQRKEDRGQRFPAGPEGPFQPSAGARRRVSVGHPNLLVSINSRCRNMLRLFSPIHPFSQFYRSIELWLQMIEKSKDNEKPSWHIVSTARHCLICISLLSVPKQPTVLQDSTHDVFTCVFVYL